MNDEIEVRGVQGNKQRRKRSKVKSGCRTCKIRKVKCDEGRPACRRCVSVGRVCDGYGIWGGGGSVCRDSQRSMAQLANYANGNLVALERDSNEKICTSPGALVGLLDSEELQCLDWFFHRAWPKLPGLYVSGFWGTLIAQVVHEEQSVLHAVIALSCVHRAGAYYGRYDSANFTRLALSSYSKAIRFLQPHFHSDNWKSTRVVLITCLTFVFLEYLRGQYLRGHQHLNNGLLLLQERTNPNAVLNATSLPIGSNDAADAWIFEMFFRIHVQSKCFLVESHALTTVSISYPQTLDSDAFQSISEARNQLDQIILDTIEVRAELRRLHYKPNNTHHRRQLEIQQRLESWLKRLQIIPADPSRTFGLREEFTCQSLMVYYTMAKIESACVLCLDESQYDYHTADFILLLQQSIEVRDRALSDNIADLLHVDHGPGMPMHSSDRGWTGPLYYTALKCRVHEIRSRAVEMIASFWHKEGLWDCQFAARIAQKVMQIEEAPAMQETIAGKQVENDKLATSASFPRPTPLYENRVYDVQVQSSKLEASEQYILTCRRWRSDNQWSRTVSRYDLALQIWTDLE